LAGLFGRVLFAGIVFVLAAPSVSSGEDGSSARPRKAAAASLSVGAAAAMVSSYRRKHGLPAVKIDSRLMSVARQQTRAMVTRDRLSHDAGGDFGARLRSAGYMAAAAAENIAAGQRSLSEAFAGWVASPSHRSNLLLRGATRIGVAAIAAPNSRYRAYWTLVIAAPLVATRHRSAKHLRAPAVDEFSGASRGGEP
jgi:uncharacterized protein YkwD